jgi:AcrR family transcriptional regulator
VETIPGHLDRLPPGKDRLQAELLSRGQRDRIMLAMTAIVAKRGYQATSVDKVIKRAKMSRGTFYAHFENREDCLLAIFDDGVARASQEVEAAAAAHSGDWPAEIQSGLIAFLDFVSENPDLARTCMVESVTAGPSASSRYEAALRLPVAAFARGRELADPSRVLPDTLEDSIVGAIVWMVHQRLLHNEVAEIRGLLPAMLKFSLAPYVGEKRSAALIATV